MACTQIAVTRLGWSGVRELITAGREWANTTNSLRAQTVHHPDALLRGRLGEAWWRLACRDNPDYVIYSYATPIAWHSPRRRCWRFPPDSYSRTTTRHQHLVLTALRPWPDTPGDPITPA